MMHFFDEQVADAVGVNAALVFQDIAFWCRENQAAGRNIREGRAWTYGSLGKFRQKFFYLGERQLRNAFKVLREAQLIQVGHFNKLPGDRTNWYSLGPAAKAFLPPEETPLSAMDQLEAAVRERRIQEAAERR